MVNNNPDQPAVGIIWMSNFHIKNIMYVLGLGYFSEQAFESMHYDVKVKLVI